MAIVIDGKFKPADPLGLYSRKANPLGASPVARTAYNPLEGNPDNEFNTPLTLEEERAFQAWKARYRPDDSGEDYDLRGAFKAGLTPDPSSDHFPDTFKKPNHPTFSTESRYAQFAADMAGSWDEAGNYVPSEARARRDAEATAAAETLQAQATYAELDKQSPGRYRLISEAEWDRWKADWDKANRSTGLVGDTIKLLDSGVAGLEQSINEIVGQIPVIGKPLQELADAFDKFAYGSPGYAQRMQEVIDRNVATLTPEMEQARGEVWWNDETNSLGGAWLNPRSYFAGAVESLPSMAATMAPAMWLARGAYLGAIAKGATERVAAAAAAKTAMVAGAVTEGSLGGAETALAVKERIQAIPREKLLEADAVQSLITQGMSEDAAIEAITSDAATQAFVMGGVATGMFGGFGDRFLAKLIAEGVGGNVAKRIVQGAVRGVVSEGLLEELPQEAFGQLSQNMALRNTVSPEQDLGEGVLNAAMGGAAIGGVMGAGIGGVGGAARPAPSVPAPDSGDEVIASGPAPRSPSAEQDAAPAASDPIPKGPLASAVDYGLANGVDAPPPMAPVAATTEVIPDETPVPVSPVTEDQAPTAGANVVVEAEGLPRFVARLEGYTQGPTGPEALVIDTSTGEELQVPLAALRTAKLTDELVEQMDAPPAVDREPVSTPDDVTRILHDAQMVLPDATHARLFDLGDKRKRDKGFVRTLGDDALRANELYEPERRALADELQIPLARVNELADDYRYRVERAARAKGAKDLPRNMHAVSTQLLQRFQIERLKAEKKGEEDSSAPLAPLTSEEEQAIFSKAQAEMDETNFPDVADDFAEQAVVAARQERLKQIEDAAEAARDPKPATTPTDRAKSIADKYLPVDAAANEAATSPRNALPEPTQAQKEAGNYKLGHIALGGLNISIENPAGSERKGTDKGGKAWSVQMKHHYGYIKGTVGRDKDHIDVFVKEGVSEVADDAPVFVVDQVVDGEFDEHKVMLGFKSLAQARNAYKANYTKGWKGLGAITQTTLGEFKAWTRDGDTSKQFARAAEPTGGVKQPDKGAQVRVPKAERPTIESEGKSDTPTGLPTGSAKKTNSNKGVQPRHPLLDETGLHPIVGEKNAINRWLNDLPQEDYDLLSEEYRGRLAIEIGMTSEPAKTFRHMKEDLAAAKARNAPKADSQTLVEKIHAKLPAGYGAEAIEGGIRVFRRYDDWTVQTLIGTPAASDVTAMLDRLHKEEASFAGPPSEQRTKPPTNGATVRQNSVDADGADPFAKNKLFTADKVAAAKARLKSKMGQLNSGIDPEVLVDGMTIAGAYIEAGVRDFADFARQMAEDFGPRIRPYLLSFWEGARNYPGLDTKGMTPPAESARLHAELNTELPAEEAAALGQELAKPKKRTPKTGRGGDRTLIQDFGVEHIDGWTEGPNGEGEPTDFGLRGGVKDHFLKDATGYLQAVSAILHDQGWAPAEDNKGRPMKAVRKNEAGPAVSGDVSLTLFHPETSGRIHVTVTASSLRGTVPSTPSGVSIMFRTGVEMDRFASRAMNQWAPVDLSAADFAKLLQEQADRAARFAKPGEASAEDRQRVIDELKGAIARPSLAPQEASDEPTGTDEPAADRGSAEGAGELRSPGEPRPQRDPAPEDRVDLAAGESADVAPTADRRSGRAARKGAAAADVGGNGPADLFGAAGDGRARAGREGASDARAGNGAAGTGGAGASVEPVKAPAAVSPANRGPGNFHIEDPLKIVGGGQVARFEKNRRAIELANTLRDEGRRATREEQEVLAGYTGWGSFGQDLFQGTWAQPRPKAGWEARDAWLRENLGQKEWESLQRSITNAHYTDPPTVLAMWDMVKRMGFGGGRVLEPSMGIGNFFGMMPVELANRSSLSGIELEQVTGEMAKLLYPDANISIMGYQSSKTPDDFYDLVIGNWPFEDTVIADRRYNKFSPFLHDYFYLKALDQVRPGGIVMGITSKGTMDKKESVIRTELAKKGELVAAFRLPSGAFEEYAGTNVVTDIIILRKRPAPLGSAADAGWIKSVPYRTPAGEEVSVNEYFVEHPDHVIGTIDFGHGTTFRRPGLIVHRPADMMGELERIKALVPEGAYRPERREARQISYITNHTDDREGALVSTRDGLFIVRGEHLAPANEVAKYELKDAKATAQRVEQLTKLIDMRRAYAALIVAERSGTGYPEAARKTLKGQYDSFVSSHGPISESYGLSYLRKIDDPFYPALAALEQRTDKGPRPAQILNSSTIRGKRTIDKPSIADAFVLARNTSIDPSLAEIAKLAGRPEAEVRAELIESGAVFETPAGDIVPSDIYLSGNVREKMRQARAGLDAGNAAMQRNIDALAKVIPPDVPYYSIEVQMGASWVPTHVYADYVAHMLNAGTSDGIAVTYTAGRWRITLSDALKARPEASAGFGTAAYRFQKLVNAAISNQTVTIRKEDSDGNVYVDQEATQEVNEKIANIRGGFGDWLWSDPERRVDLEAEYNEVRNAYASPSFDGSFLTFEGMALSLGRGPFDLREHQVNAIWRALVTRRSLNAHEVGTGKTFTMGGIAVESRRYGIARKPLIFAHNANSASVAAEIQQMYPAAKVLYIDNLAPAQIDVKMRQIANDDWDAIVVPHSLISRFALTEETLMAQAAEEIAAIEAEAYAAAADDGSTLTERMLDDPDELKKLRSPTAKDLVKTRNRIIENIRKQGQRASKEGAIPFEELGVDMVLVDEAHEFKKPPFSTRMRIKGLSTQSSDRSIALSFLLRYIRSTQNGGNVHLFTGTPVTNTLTEVFHMMRYIMAEEMSAVDVDQWDGWFGSFAREVQDVELNAAAEYEAVNRLAGFINVPELRRMIGQYMDVVFASDMPEMQPRRTQSGKTLDDKSLSAKEQAELLNGRTEGAKDRPYKKVIVETADLTPYQQQAFREIQRYAQRWRNFNGKEKKEAMLAGAPESPIIYENLAAKASFDVRLMRGEDFAGKEGQTEDDPNSKASRVVRNVLEIYNSSPLATQVVFTNAGLSNVATRSTGATGEKSQVRFKVFSTVQDIVERLVAQGIPRDQIAIVDGSTSKEKRKEVADAMNLAKIRVVIGSTQSLGVGVNMQRNLRAMHHMDAPWMPGDLEQRNGRGLRQGNQWNTVLEYRYLTDRIDGRRWQVLAIKQRFINAFLRADDSTRVIEGDAASEEESDILTTFAEAAGDPRVLIRAKLRKKIDQLLNRRRMHDNGVVDARRSADRLEKRRAELEAEHKRLFPIAEKADALSQAMAGDGFRLKLGKQEFDERGEAREAIDSLVDGMADFGPGAEPRVIGEFGGYPLRVEWPRRSENHVLTVVIDREPVIGRSGSLQSLERTLRKYRAGVDEMAVEIREAARSAERLAAQAKEPFHQQGDLARAEREFAALELDLAQNPVPPPAWLRSGAPVDTEIFWNREKHVVSGHRWNSAGWFVLTSGAEGPVEIPYLEARDEQGMQLYAERPFVAPEVVEKASKSEGSTGPAEDGEAVADIAPAGRAFHAPRTEAVIDEIANSPFGEVVANLMEMGRVRIVAGAGSRAPSPMAMAWTEPDGRITLNASLIGPGEAVGVLLHEAFHSGAERLIGSKAWTELQAELQTILKQFSRGNGRARHFYDAARDRIARAREEVTISDALAAEELAAYAIEEYETAPKVLRDWVDKLVGVVKAWLLRRFGRQLGAVTPAQLREIAALALRDAVGAPNGPAPGPAARASIKAPKPVEVKASAKGTWTDVQPHLLATVPLTYFSELARPNMSAVDQYLKVKRQMDAYRGELHAEADALAQDWLKFSRMGGLFRSETGDAQTAALARLMHDATLAGVDPSKTDEETRKLPGYEKLRENFRSLPAEAQRLFVRVRDAYADQARELDDLIIASVEKAQKLAQKKARETYEAEVDRIRSSGLKGLELKDALDAASDRFAKDNIRSTYANKARATKLRQQFENNRVPTPYFPLARFGRYTVTVRDQEGAVVSFSRRERAADNTRLAEEMKAAYPKYTVETGVIDEAGAGFRDAMDPRIVADIQKILGDSGVDSSVMDAIWQRYLQSMPDLSTRKRFIHRKGTAGFEGDALRAFSSHMFHASHQMARLKHGLDLQEMLDQAAIQARKSDDPIRGGTLVNELGKRHKWVMNPTGSSAVQAVTSAMFVWYLGLTPAAALVNLTQTPMLGVPIIGARFGIAKTAAALLQASRDFVAGKADMRQSPKITAEEREILNRFYESGLIDRTQSHELAGVGDTGVRYSALRSRIMGGISWAFHKTEVANREVTALAAYRLARGSGLSVQAALDAAHDLTWKVHFDYSNSSRPRLLQGDAAKLLLVFQNYQVNMLYRLSRDLHQAFAGETAQAKKEARYQLAGIFGMMTLLGGVSGMFGFHILMAVLGMFLGDKDDPFDFENQMRRNTLDLFGPDVGGMILNGVPGHLLKIDLTSRIGMPDLFVRTPDNASIEGRDWWQEMIVNALGVVPSTVINVGDGFGLMAEGNMVRGLELMMPKAFKDVMQAYRFANEGLTTRRGDEIRPADQFSAYDFVVKAMGFTPAAVAETYDRNSALMNANTRVMDLRSMLLNQYALAIQNQDEVLLDQAIERIKAFNQVPLHRGVRITADTLRKSLQTRRRNSQKREDGVLIQNERLGRDLRALQPARVNG